MRLTTIGLLLCLALTASAQNFPSGSGPGSKGDSTKNFSFMPIPYINYSRSTEFAYGILPLAMYKLNKKDTISPSSMSGGIYMRTTNGTWFGMGFSQFYLKQDTYRITVAGGTGNINFQFYPDLPLVPEVVPYSTGMDFFVAQVQRKIVDKMYGGLGYVYTNLATSVDIIGIPTQYTRLDGIRVLYSYDRRDDVYYPYDGSIVNVNYSTFPEFMKNENVSNKIEVDYNQFFSFNEQDVVAVRAFIGIGIGDLDFNQQFIVGRTDLRGYSQGAFRGDQQYAIQGEYRWNLANRFGLVGFAGVATVLQSINEDDNGKLLPAAGGGFRITVFPKNHMNIGMDAGIGVDDWGIEFRIGEAF